MLEGCRKLGVPVRLTGDWEREERGGGGSVLGCEAERPFVSAWWIVRYE